MIGSTLAVSAAQDVQDDPQQRTLPIPSADPDAKLPNGKSQRDAIAKVEHEQSLKDAARLVTLAEQIRDELQKAGNYVVPFSTVKKTEEIEKLARKIRARLKD
ncbi:MAG: hypothetical protein M3Y27_06265 [Acidobacteriota bacterium]|nr:hypothetical protein [Acidobacteriota bacterium]